jgi:hypothetical protein
MQFPYVRLPRWHVSQCSFANGPTNHHLSLVGRLCTAGLARKPARMLQLIRTLQKALTFLRQQLLPVVRRYEPWHSVLVSCATSLEEAVLTCAHATNQEFP